MAFYKEPGGSRRIRPDFPAGGDDVDIAALAAAGYKIGSVQPRLSGIFAAPPCGLSETATRLWGAEALLVRKHRNI